MPLMTTAAPAQGPPPGMMTPGTTPGFSQLDGPPPDLSQSMGMNNGMPPLGSLVAPVPASGLPQPMLDGMQATFDRWMTEMQGMAQATPDLAPDWNAVMQAVLNVRSKLQQAGAGPTAPTSPGAGFPAGGIDERGSGGPPLAPVGR